MSNGKRKTKTKTKTTKKTKTKTKKKHNLCYEHFCKVSASPPIASEEKIVLLLQI